jgi:hypothetical protein
MVFWQLTEDARPLCRAGDKLAMDTPCNPASDGTSRNVR